MSYLCIDPSCLGSERRVFELADLLRTVKEERRQIKLVLPTTVYDILTGRNFGFKDGFMDIAKKWGGFTVGHALDSSKHTSLHERVLSELKDVLDSFGLSSISALVPHREKIGKNSIFRNDVLKKLGRCVGEIVWEMMSFSERMGASIISFGEKTMSLISSVGVSTLKWHSEYKKTVKERAGIKSTLKFMRLVMYPALFAHIVADYEMGDWPPIAEGIGGFGLLMVADG